MTTAESSDPDTAAVSLALELRWYEGRLLPLVPIVQDFVVRYRQQIVLRAGDRSSSVALLAATKVEILCHGSLHMRAEARDQIQEMQNEIWFRGEKGDYDHARIQHEWTEIHAPAWRQWRLREYLFVADRCADQVVKILREPPE